ncbi:MAG: hypothetical protein C0429_10110 [Sphingopyxis sp.]|jgi:hypothetical protein|nr:hypothetical protein [Sphingopyxis sp.]
MRNLGVSVMSCVAIMLATPAEAQTSVREACMADIQKFCSPELATFSRDKVRACLIRNIQKASPGCKEAAKAQRDRQRALKSGAAGKE